MSPPLARTTRTPRPRRHTDQQLQCDVCHATLNAVELHDADACRDRGDPGCCTNCLRTHSVRPATETDEAA